VIDTHASAHGRRDRDLAQVDTLRRSRLGLVQGVDQCDQVGLQLFVAERLAADRGVDDTCLVGTVLDLTCLGVLDGASDVRDKEGRQKEKWIPSF
jgi:hypothetical protein